MRLVFLFIKFYPFFGLALSVLSWDLARNFKRKGRRAWVGMIVLMLFFLISTGLWVFFRGYKNADVWFRELVDWLSHG